MRTLIVLALAFAAVAAYSDPFPDPQRIVGGSFTTIDAYPSMAALLFSWIPSAYIQQCGGSILNNRSILTAAQCTFGHVPVSWRVRLGSTYPHGGGALFNTVQIINHPFFNVPVRYDNDISILRLDSNIGFTNVIQPAPIAGANYNLGDNQVVWAAGWGYTAEVGFPSEQLRHIQIWTVNQAPCRNYYAVQGWTVTDNMLCSGWLGVGGRGQCQLDTGGPLYHNGIVVGVFSWGIGCGDAYLPGVNTRVSRYTAWIQSNS